MKNRLIEIIAQQLSDEEKAKQIIALAVIKDGPRYGLDDEEAVEEILAFRQVIETLGSCTASEVSISPKLVSLLCFEAEMRGQAFARAEAKEIYGPAMRVARAAHP